MKNKNFLFNALKIILAFSITLSLFACIKKVEGDRLIFPKQENKNSESTAVKSKKETEERIQAEKIKPTFNPQAASNPQPMFDPNATLIETSGWQDQSVTSIHNISILVNKSNSLKENDIPALATFPNDYAIGGGYSAHPEVVQAYTTLVDHMVEETGMKTLVASAYRSYKVQKDLFNNYVSREGLANASRYSARPGQSEHQTGLALDIVKPGGSLNCFSGTSEARWIQKNAHRFGFIIRYPQDKEHITGYMYEPWHIRYLGISLATAVYNSELTYEEYWELYQPAAFFQTNLFEEVMPQENEAEVLTP